jgi:periplasmic divalent cation tolerance protein
MADELVVLVTCSAEEADKLAQVVVEEHLAACVNIIPKIKSVYFFEGKLCKDDETLLIMKTVRHKFSLLETRIRALHSYQVPEIISVAIELGSGAYLEWLNQAVKG